MGLNALKDSSWLAHSAKPNSHFTCIWFLKVGICVLDAGIKTYEKTEAGLLIGKALQKLVKYVHHDEQN